MNVVKRWYEHEQDCGHMKLIEQMVCHVSSQGKLNELLNTAEVKQKWKGDLIFSERSKHLS